MNEYKHLINWRDGHVSQHLDQVAADVAVNRPEWLDERAIRAYAAALVSITITDEWFQLRAAAESRQTRTADNEVLAEDILDKIEHARPRRNWIEDLADLGRTRTIGYDTEYIRQGHPERGQYYWLD